MTPAVAHFLCHLLLATLMGAQGAVPGPVVISEIMVNPINVDDVMGEWIEVTNTGDYPVDLSGWVLVDGLGNERILSAGTPFVIQGGDIAVLASSQTIWDLFPLLMDVYVYDDLVTLDNTSGCVSLYAGEELVDEVCYVFDDTFPAPPGQSLNLDPACLDADANDDLVGCWCSTTGGQGQLYGENVGTPGESNPECDNDGDGFTEALGDCDDSDSSVAPDSPEVCNGVDDDCNGEEDDILPNLAPIQCNEGGVCAGIIPTCKGEAGWICKYPSEYEEVEKTCDGLDNDCDGETDEGLLNACDFCGAVPTEICNGKDDDCDGLTDEELSEPSDFEETCLSKGVCAGFTVTCLGRDGWACVYGAEHEAGAEVSCDGLDNDCDGHTDEDFILDVECYVGKGSCFNGPGRTVCNEAGDGIVCGRDDGTGEALAPFEPTEELCGDGLDNDCDGETDEGFSVGAACTIGVGACQVTGKYVCSKDLYSLVCAAGDPLPPSWEICGDQLDNDCDGTTDEEMCKLPVGDDDEVELGGGGSCSARAGASHGFGLVTLVGCLALIGLVRRRRHAS